MKIIHSVKFIESIWHFPWDCVRIKNSCKSWKRKDKGMKAGICYIVGAGENYGLEIRPNEDDFVVAVDAGYRLLEEQGIGIDLVIGDFDTLQYIPAHPNVIVLKAEKDDTDMLAAVREGIRAGYGKFHIYCGTGGRLDHTVANMQLLADLSRYGRQGFLIDRDSVVTAITDSTLFFPGEASGYVSVFSHTEKSEGVYLKGLKYPLEDAVLDNHFPLGISNEFTEAESSISVRRGTLLVFFPRDCFGNGVPAERKEPGS